MKTLALILGRRALKRWVKRRSPKASLVGGSALSIVLTGVMLACGVPDEVAALIGPQVGALATTAVNLLFGDHPEDDDGSASTT